MVKFEGFSEEAFTWINLVRAIQHGSATKWFAQYPAVSGQDVMTTMISPEHGFLRDSLGFLADWSVTKPFGVFCPDSAEWLSRDSRRRGVVGTSWSLQGFPPTRGCL